MNKLGMTIASTFGVPTFDSFKFTERAPKKHAEDAIHWDHYGVLRTHPDKNAHHPHALSGPKQSWPPKQQCS